ncbi:MAG: OmpH family outer membrane protein [Bacteroidetes bacterium]|nr:OmpH family outer membrane protein [Bacteroidota bacterium]
MKNLSLILNAVLIIAVAFLFYEVHTLKSAAQPAESVATQKTDSASDVKIMPAVNGPSTLADAKIAYVNTDVFNEKYEYITDMSKDLKGRKDRLESVLQSMTEKIQQDYEAYQQSAQTGIAPAADLKRQEESIEKQKNDIANKQMQLQNLGYELEEKQMQLNESMKKYLVKYNNGRFDYILSYSDMVPTILLTNSKLDITEDVLKGMNEEYKASKAKK